MSDDASRAHAAAALVILRTRVDAHFEAAVARTPGAFACRDGCASCCQVRFGVLEVEAARVRAALRELGARDPAMRARVRAQAGDARHRACALLVDDRCSVYAERPLICRSHGLPIRVEHDDGRTAVDVCPLNFVDTPPPAASVLVLEAVNAPLAVLGRMWDDRDGRVALADLAASADDAEPSADVSPC